ncbi:MAG: phytoene desaturase family protein [Actinomycetes bacterium]
MAEVDAVVVGAGPNGLAAAAFLARAGASVVLLEADDTLGGGTRSTDDLTLPGVVHDICSAVHPFGAGSPAFDALDLGAHGLAWCHPDVTVGHPLAPGTAVLGVRDVGGTADGLGVDAGTYRAWFDRPARRWDDLADDLLGPLLRVPRHPFLAAEVGLRALLPATTLASRLRTTEARALFAGMAAHAILPLESPLTASFGLLLGAAGHANGWPVARGGSQAIADALLSVLRAAGGEVRTGVRVASLSDLPTCRVALLDVTPRQLVDIAGTHLHPRMRRAAEGWRYGPGAFKLDLAVEGGVPWTVDGLRRAGTVHLGGTLEQIAHAERMVHEGVVVDEPYVLLAQQSVADPSRAVGDVHPVWAYCHVPNGWTGDATEHILGSVERHAPGFRDRIVGSHTWSPAAFEAHDANYVGGDIAGGSHGGLQLLGRPRLALDPYRTGTPGLFLCSSSTPPGGGVHGMPGMHAAASALRALG